MGRSVHTWVVPVQRSTLSSPVNTLDPLDSPVIILKLSFKLQPLSKAPHHFPPSNFTYSWTLFSKFFSSFPHGTCSLSVSTLYLALGDLYLPLQAAISSNPTLRTHVDTQQTPRAHTGLSPSVVEHSRSLSLGCSRDSASLHYNSVRVSQRTDFQFGLFPVHSPLLQESKFLSFPPLNNMLKFRGSSHSNWDW